MARLATRNTMGWIVVFIAVLTFDVAFESVGVGEVYGILVLVLIVGATALPFVETLEIVSTAKQLGLALTGDDFPSRIDRSERLDGASMPAVDDVEEVLRLAGLDGPRVVEEDTPDCLRLRIRRTWTRPSMRICCTEEPAVLRISIESKSDPRAYLRVERLIRILRSRSPVQAIDQPGAG